MSNVLDRTASSSAELRAGPGIRSGAREDTAWSVSQVARGVAANLSVAVLYWAVAELTLLPTTVHGRITPMWPAAGVAVAAMLLGGSRLIPGIAAGALIATSLHMSIASAFAVAVGIVLEAVIDARLLKRCHFDERLERVRDPLVLSSVSLVGAAVAALLSTMAVVIQASPSTREPLSWFTLWWMRDWLGVQLVVALALTWVHSRRPRWTWPRIVEALGLVTGLSVLSVVMFQLWSVFPGQNAFAFLTFPIVGYAGFRFGPAGAATLVAVVAAAALPVAALGLGPFAPLPIVLTHVLMHTFLLSVWLSGQTLAAVIAEREDAMQRRLALEEQLRHSQKMEAVGRLVGGIAHDFNNLLTAIIGYTEIVMVSLEPDDPRRADAEEIARAAMRAADLTRQMLVFSRKQNLKPEVINLNLILSKVDPMLRRVIGEDIVMTMAPKATRAQVRVDPGQVEQVIMNLCVNARDAMPRGGRLTVETGDVMLDAGTLPPGAAPGAYAMLAVSDTGIGMSADVRARIFEPYFTTKDVGKGTGLGLSTVYGIIKQSDGHIHVYSEPGLGTTFRVYLPRSEGAAVVERVADEQMPRGTEHILLVEDDPTVRRMSREVLVRLGYSLTEAASGRAGLALGGDDTKHFDLALCDVILGDMSGPSVYEALRALRPSVRVLYMSGYADEAIVKTGVLDEGHPFLPKPFTPRDLAVKIRDVLDRPEDQ